MPSKKKIKMDPEPVVAQSQSVMVEQHNVREQGTCIECRHMLTGSWRGPTCLNKQSPKYSQRVKDAGTCDFFTSRGSRAPEPVLAEGLYDPEPRTDLQELLDRETEARDD